MHHMSTQLRIKTRLVVLETLSLRREDLVGAPALLLQELREQHLVRVLSRHFRGLDIQEERFAAYLVHLRDPLRRELRFEHVSTQLRLVPRPLGDDLRRLACCFALDALLLDANAALPLDEVGVDVTRSLHQAIETPAPKRVCQSLETVSL